VGASAADVVLLDNVEVLFDVSLKQDPLRLLQGLSRNKTVVAAWSGEIRTEGRGLRTEVNTDDSALSPHHSIWSMRRRTTPNTNDIPYEISW